MTLVLLAMTGLAMHASPPPMLAVQLMLLMLPVQFAIGVVNDLADVVDDTVTKPYKPLVRGAVSRQAAGALAVVLAMAGVAAAATVGLVVLGLTLAGLASGLAYDLGARRTLLSIVPWWGGLLVLPMLGFAASNRLSAALWPAVPLTLMIALSLHCANAYPDIEGDRRTGKRALPVRLGRRWSLTVMSAAMALAGLLMLTVFRPAAGLPLLIAACGVEALVLVALNLGRVSRPFALLAVPTALLAVSWLAGVAAA